MTVLVILVVLRVEYLERIWKENSVRDAWQIIRRDLRLSGDSTSDSSTFLMPYDSSNDTFALVLPTIDSFTYNINSKSYDSDSTRDSFIILKPYVNSIDTFAIVLPTIDSFATV